jgi:RAP domain
VFGKFPAELMNILYTGTFGAGSLQNANDISLIYGDDGLSQKVSLNQNLVDIVFLFATILLINTNVFDNYYIVQAFQQLVQLQTAMDLAQAPSDISLPNNFPEEWMHMERLASIAKLDLTTSNLQKSISKSLKELGFSHVVEHTISMREMAGIYSINVPPKEYDVLSIDIANVEEKIAIEVDGPTHFILCIDSKSILNPGNSHQLQYKYDANGATMLKHRLLTSMGWTVLNVPYREWYKLRDDPRKKNQYCQDLLTSISK